MYFEIIETYPAEIFDSSLNFMNIFIKNTDGKNTIKESVKILLNNSSAEASVRIIESVLNFCYAVISNDNNSELCELKIDLKNLELNTFVRTSFRVVPDSAKIVVEKDKPNAMYIVFSHESASLTDEKFNIGISTFYFIFSCLINIRNYVDYNSHSFTSAVKKQVLTFKTSIDMLFDMLIVSDKFKGLYECRLAKSTDSIKKEEDTVLSAIKNGSRSYGVKAYSMFTVYDYPFLVIEHNDKEETALFEYEFKNMIYKVNID